MRYDLDLSVLHPEAMADPDLVKGVLTNLLENAAQAAGEVRVKTFVEGERLSVEVHDSGPGLSEQARATLFEPSICEGMYMSEDWTFCERWVNGMGNKVYIDVGVQLTHIGLEEFKGAFLSLLL